MTRVERLRERLDERLLVTNLVNVRYLTGFDASNAALLVDPAGPAKLFTDFRYLESAQEVNGVEAHQTKRALLARESLDRTLLLQPFIKARKFSRRIHDSNPQDTRLAARWKGATGFSRHRKRSHAGHGLRRRK